MKNRNLFVLVCLIVLSYGAFSAENSNDASRGGIKTALDNSVGLIRADEITSNVSGASLATVAVVDTGVNSTHPAIDNNLVNGGNFYTDADPDGSTEDIQGHGTHVACIIASQDDLYPGVAPNADIINVKASITELDDAVKYLYAGVNWAIDNGANIISMSQARSYVEVSTTGNFELTKFVDYIAYQRNTPFIVCAGNRDSTNNPDSHIEAPGDNYNGITVGSVTKGLALDSDSGRNVTDDGRTKIDVLAPGDDIWSCNYNWSDWPEEIDDYTTKSGTSQATPHVSGVAAMLFHWGDLNSKTNDPVLMKAAIMNSATKLSGWSHTHLEPLDRTQGAGLLNAVDAYRTYISRPSTDPTGYLLHSRLVYNASDRYTRVYVDDAPTNITATIVWRRNVTNYNLTPADLTDFDLYLYDGDMNEMLNWSASNKDNVEHVYYEATENGIYWLNVDVYGGALENGFEYYALASNKPMLDYDLTYCTDCDGDGVNNTADYYPLNSSAWQLETTCSSCEDCSNKLDGNYTVVKLTTNITDYPSRCITFNSDNVEFDCQGYTIDSSGINDGIFMLYKDNNTVRNCIITGFSDGIYLYGSNNNTILNNTLTSNSGNGIYVYYSDGATITDNNASNNDGGIYLSLLSDYHTIANNTANSNTYRGIYVGGSYNTITNNTMNSNTWQGMFVGTSADNNTITANTAQSNGINGIRIYNSDNNTISSNRFCSNTQEDFYFANGTDNSGDENSCDTVAGWNDTGVTGCSYTCAGATTTSTTTSTSSTLTTSTTSTSTTTTLSAGNTCSSCSGCNAKLDGTYSTVQLTASISNKDGNCITFSDGNIEFDCQGHTIDGDGDDYGTGIYLHLKSDSTIRNCVITGFDKGILLSSTSFSTLVNNTVSNNVEGIRFSSAMYNTVNSNTVCSNTEADFSFSGSNSGNSGDENTCDIPGDWSDDGTTGCTYACSATTTTSTSTSTSTTIAGTTTSTTSTSTTISGGCDLVGDDPPCGEVGLAEVIDLISLWAADGASLADVIDLISAWSSG